jgi:hypothetical protein
MTHMLVLFCGNGFIVTALQIILTITYLNTIYPKLSPPPNQPQCCQYTTDICNINYTQINNRYFHSACYRYQLPPHRNAAKYRLFYHFHIAICELS